MKIKKKLWIMVLVAIVVTVLGIPWYAHAQKATQRKACLNSLRMLCEPLVCCVPLSESLHLGDKIDPQHVFQFTRGIMPVCPAGGTYIVSWVVGGLIPKCSKHGDLLGEIIHVKTLEELAKIRKIEYAQPSAESDSTNHADTVREPLQQ